MHLHTSPSPKYWGTATGNTGLEFPYFFFFKQNILICSFQITFFSSLHFTFFLTMVKPEQKTFPSTFNSDTDIFQKANFS